MINIKFHGVEREYNIFIDNAEISRIDLMKAYRPTSHSGIENRDPTLLLVLL